MSFDSYFIQYPSSKGTLAEAMDPNLFFAPDPQLAYAPSPESFDREVDNDKEFEELDVELSFKEFDDFFATFGDTIPGQIAVPTPSAVTYSTESLYSSQYSCDLTSSDYSIPSEIESCGSVYDGLDNAHASVYSPAFSDSLPSIPPPSPAKAIIVQESFNTASLSVPVHLVPDKAHKARGSVKPFKCPTCPLCESPGQVFYFLLAHFSC